MENQVERGEVRVLGVGINFKDYCQVGVDGEYVLVCRFYC